MGLQFHETEYGKRFFDVQLPSLIKAVERLADANGKQQAAEPAVDTTANMVYVSAMRKIPTNLQLKTARLMRCASPSL